MNGPDSDKIEIVKVIERAHHTMCAAALAQKWSIFNVKEKVSSKGKMSV